VFCVGTLTVRALVGPTSAIKLVVKEEVLEPSSIGIWCGGGSTFKGVGVVVSLGMDTIIPSLSEADDGIDVDVAVGCGMSGCALETAVPKS
jgi:hypothetical protein